MDGLGLQVPAEGVDDLFEHGFARTCSTARTSRSVPRLHAAQHSAHYVGFTVR